MPKKFRFPHVINPVSAREDRFLTLGEGTITADEMWLSGRLQRAQAQGETLELTPAEQELAKDIAARAAGAAERWDEQAHDRRLLVGRRRSLLGRLGLRPCNIEVNTSRAVSTKARTGQFRLITEP